MGGGDDRIGSIHGALLTLNTARAKGDPEGRQETEILERLPADSSRVLARAAMRLAVYGTLAPGERNHDRLERYRGTWTEGLVHGTLYPAGWGAAFGAPALVWHADGDPVRVALLESDDLAAAWPLLDEFEGDEYMRVLVPVQLDDGVRVANLYALRSETERRLAAAAR